MHQRQYNSNSQRNSTLTSTSMGGSNAWLNWAEEEAAQKTRPVVAPRRHASEETSRRYISNEDTFIKQTSYEKTNTIVPTEEQLSYLMPMPAQCFCGKPAHRSFTHEYGPILECNRFGTDPSETTHKVESKFVCGFHVHENSWQEFRNTLKKGGSIHPEYPELRSCVLYNFTFCAIFRMTNKYNIEPPAKLPNCFCHRPVCMRIRPNRSIIFACKNGNVDGARKCSWVLSASEVAFPRPTHRLHTLVSKDEYLEKKDQMLEKLKNTSSSPPKEKHKVDLLATLSASLNKESSDALPMLSNLSLQQQPQQQQQQPKDTTSSVSKSLIVPTCVLAHAKRPNPQPILSRSSSTSSCSVAASSPSQKSTNLPIENANNELLQLANQQIAILNQELAMLEAEMRKTKMNSDERVDQLKSTVASLQTELYRNKNESNEESVLRLNCQERLSSIELDLVHLMNDNEKLNDELRTYVQEGQQAGKEEENKCRLCFTRNIDYCLIPCYHFAYCHLCAQKLTECAICRREIHRIQKIYTC